MQVTRDEYLALHDDIQNNYRTAIDQVSAHDLLCNNTFYYYQHDSLSRVSLTFAKHQTALQGFDRI